MTTEHRAARLLRWGAGPLVACCVLTACSSDDAGTDTSTDPATTTQVAAAAAPATSAGSPAPSPTSSGAPASSVVPTVVELPEPDGADLLQRALDAASASGYHFLSTVTVGSTVALTVEGDRVGDATRMTVASNGTSVDWIITPAGSWAAQGGSWQELEETAPVSDPLAPLRSPERVVVTAHDESTTAITASYPTAAFGLAGEGTIDVVVEISGTAVRSLSYETSDGTAMTTVRTELSPLADTSPVTVPAT